MKIDLKKIDFPPEFYEFILKDIDPGQFYRAINEYPELQSTIFKGFSLSKKKIGRILSHPKVQVRIKTLARHSNRFLDFLIGLWSERNKEKIDFFRCLRAEFIWENLENFKNAFGASALFCILYNLEIENKEGEVNLFGNDFWVENEVCSEDFLKPFTIVKNLLTKSADEKEELPESIRSKTEKDGDVKGSHDRSLKKRLEKKLKKQQEIVKNLEGKIEKLNLRHKKDSETLKRYKELIADYREEIERERKIRDEVIRREKRNLIKKLFSNYESVSDLRLISSVSSSLDSIFKQADRALRLQQKADEEYGKISELRTKLLKIDQYLDEISRIYSDSVFIHSEVKKVKRLLEEERDRILSLPRAEVFFQVRRDDSWEHDLVRKLSLLDPTPGSLQLLKSLRHSIENLSGLGIQIDTDFIYSAVKKKETAILTYLSEKFCSECDPDGKIEIVRDLDQFIKGGSSKNFDLYVDAYNILLSANDNHPISEMVFREIREGFTKAVVRLGNSFNRVYLVFDGIGSDREKYGNVDVLFADRFRGESADEIIIRLLNRRSDTNAVLATADREIIAQTKDKVFATVEPHNFFSCLYDCGFTTLFCGRLDDLV